MPMPRRNYIRDGADPAVKFLLEQIPGSKAAMAAEVAAGLGTDTIRVWRYRCQPRVDCLRRALNALGYDLAVIDRSTGQVVP